MSYIRICVVVALLALLASVQLFAADAVQPVKYDLNHDGTRRTYSMYLPHNIKPGSPLVVYVHGYGSKTRWVADLNAAADSAGFAVCYPDGLPDSRGKEGWKVGYPPQESMVIDEAAFFHTLLDSVCTRFSLSRENVFCAGMSNGGDLCYQFAYTAPSLFKAYASVAGLTFECTYMNNQLTLPVPFMEIHGNADKVSMWQGDHANTGGWGSYIPVPLAVAAVAAANRCTEMTIDTVPSKKGPEHIIRRTTYSGSPSGCDVVVYEIDGGKHSWAAKDLNTGAVVWEFFSKYLKKD